MARRRTRAEKIAAGVRENNSVVTSTASINPVKNNPSYFVSEIPLSTKLIFSDLTKSLTVAILALILQFMLCVYLNRGGWQVVSLWLQNFTTVYK
jgi:hypothetical protein